MDAVLVLLKVSGDLIDVMTACSELRGKNDEKSVTRAEAQGIHNDDSRIGIALDDLVLCLRGKAAGAADAARNRDAEHILALFGVLGEYALELLNVRRRGGEAVGVLAERLVESVSLGVLPFENKGCILLIGIIDMSGDNTDIIILLVFFIEIAGSVCDNREFVHVHFLSRVIYCIKNLSVFISVSLPPTV